jgi:hypothetical protein
MSEEWKTIPGLEDYLISSNGRVKSYRNGKEKILKGSISVSGYKQYQLNGRTYGAHQIVAMAYLDYTPCGMSIVVDHIDTNKLNNNVSNLRLLSHRDNVHRFRKNRCSIFKGIYFHFGNTKYVARIYINKKMKYLGSFDCHIKAHLEYLKAIKNLEKL